MLRYALSIFASLLISNLAFASEADEFPEDGPSSEMIIEMQGQSQFPPNIDYIIKNLGKRDSFTVGVPAESLKSQENIQSDIFKTKVISKKQIGNNILVEIDTTSDKSNFTPLTIHNQIYNVNDDIYSLNYYYGYGYVVEANLMIKFDKNSPFDEQYKYLSNKISKMLVNKGYEQRTGLLFSDMNKEFKNENSKIVISKSGKHDEMLLIKFSNEEVIKQATESLNNKKLGYSNKQERDIDRIFK